MLTQYLIQMLVLLNTIELECYNPFERCQTYCVSAAYLRSLELPQCLSFLYLLQEVAKLRIGNEYKMQATFNLEGFSIAALSQTSIYLQWCLSLFGLSPPSPPWHQET